MQKLIRLLLSTIVWWQARKVKRIMRKLYGDKIPTDYMENKDWESLRDWHIKNPRKYFYEIENEHYKDTISRLKIALAETIEERDKAWEIALSGRKQNPNFYFIAIHELDKKENSMSDGYVEETEPVKIHVNVISESND